MSLYTGKLRYDTCNTRLHERAKQWAKIALDSTAAIRVLTPVMLPAMTLVLRHHDIDLSSWKVVAGNV